MNRKQKNTAKTIIIVFIILILGCGVLMAITKGFTDWNPYGWFDKEPDTEEKTETSNDCFVIDENGTSLSSDVVYSMPKKLGFTATVENSVKASEGVKIKADVLPSYATYKLSWFLRWAPQTDVQRGQLENYLTYDGVVESATNYVELLISEKENEVTLKCKNNFFVSIELVCKETISKLEKVVLLDYLYVQDAGDGTPIDGSLEVENIADGMGLDGVDWLYISNERKVCNEYGLYYWIYDGETDDEIVSLTYGTKAYYTSIVSYELVFSEIFLDWLKENKNMEIPELIHEFSNSEVRFNDVNFYDYLISNLGNHVNNEAGKRILNEFLGYAKEFSEEINTRFIGFKIYYKNRNNVINTSYKYLEARFWIVANSLDISENEVLF